MIFGFPGDGINGIFESIRTHAEKIDFVQVRHEEAAAFMATGYAKFTGQLGVCLAASGPGGIHLLNGLYDAKMDGQPVLAITGMHISARRKHRFPASIREPTGRKPGPHLPRSPFCRRSLECTDTRRRTC